MKDKEISMLKDASEIDSFMDLTEKNLDNFRLYKLMEFPNQEYGITVTEFKKEKLSGQDGLKPSVEQIVAYGKKDDILTVFEKTRDEFILNPHGNYSSLLDKSVKTFQINEGEVLKGTVKNIKLSINDGVTRMADVVIENEMKTFVLRVKDELKERFQIGQLVAIQKTSEGLHAQIIHAPRISNNLKM